MELSHDKLVDIGRRYLFRHHPIVVTELSNGGSETPDVIGWANGTSVLIECKISKSDYYSDRSKFFRRNPSMGIGDFRYFLTPKGLVDPEYVPCGWGLLETSGVRVVKVKNAVLFPVVNKAHEIVILTSAMRRIGQVTPKGVSVKAYYQHTGDRATLTMESENQPQGELC